MSILKRNPNPNIPTIKRKDKLHQRYYFIAKKKKEKLLFLLPLLLLRSSSYITPNPPTWMQHERRDRDDTGQRGPAIHRERHPLWRSHGPVDRSKILSLFAHSLSFFNTAHAHGRRKSISPHPLLNCPSTPGHDDGKRGRRRQLRAIGDRDPGTRATFGDGQQVSEWHIIFHVPRGLIENLYGAERQSLLRHRYTPAGGEPGGGAGVLLLVPLLLPLMLPCWWWWWWWC